jgi:REP element-mobilizing transposase RayT
MGRRPRLHAPGAFYHVTLRGNHRQPIFFRSEDRDLLDRLVEDALASLAARVHAYCWMPNHLHLLVQVSDAPLGWLMSRIASSYARTVQLRLKTTGHLFERRYHAVLVDADSYLLTLLRYIHLNPVRAGIVADPSQFPWSSHHCYVGRVDKSWVTSDLGLSLFASRRADAIEKYRQFMASRELDRWGHGRLAPLTGQPQVLGDEDFASKLANAGGASPPKSTLDELASTCCERFGVTLESLTSQSRGRRLAPARAWLGHEALARGIATVCAIGRFLGRTEGALRHLMLRYPPAVDD